MRFLTESLLLCICTHRCLSPPPKLQDDDGDDDEEDDDEVRPAGVLKLGLLDPKHAFAASASPLHAEEPWQPASGVCPPEAHQPACSAWLQDDDDEGESDDDEGKEGAGPARRMAPAAKDTKEQPQECKQQ